MIDLIPCLVGKTNKSGRTTFYWQPSAALTRAGWKSLPLGNDREAAIAAAKRRNAEVEDWRAGGARPREVKRMIKAHTLDALIEKFKLERFPALAASTQKDMRSKFRTLSAWAGTQPVNLIGRRDVRTLRDALMKPFGPDKIVRHTMAHGTLKYLRVLLGLALELEWISENPAQSFNLGTPPPREQYWSPDARDALAAAAGAPYTVNGVEYPADASIALAAILGVATGQREGDLLKLQQRQYVSIPRHKIDDDAVWHGLLGEDGRVMGLRIRQGKTKRWIEVPVSGETRAMLEAGIARAKKASAMTILVDDRTDLPWAGDAGETRFQRRFADTRARAIEQAIERQDDALAAELKTLQFRDFRRTCVVQLGELGLADHLISAITGHSLEETKDILEVYMPRTTAMAARAVHLRDASNAKIEQKEVQG